MDGWSLDVRAHAISIHCCRASESSVSTQEINV